MSNMTEYELHTQGGVIAMSPKYDGRDPMRNRPHSNGTDTTMKIQRYGLGREYAGNTGSPAITEQADGAYVRYEDFQRMEAGYKNHNDLMVLRTKRAEEVAAGTLINEGTKSAQPNHSEDARHMVEPSDDDIIALAVRESLGIHVKSIGLITGLREDADISEYVIGFARALLKRVQPANGDAARYRWLRSSHVGPESLASLHQWVNDDCNPPYTELKYGDELDAAIDAAMQQGGQL